MHKILEKLKEEFFAILPPTIFFFVALHLLTFIRVLIAKGSNFQPLSTMSIAIASLILGKAVLIADMLPPINRYPNKPLAYNIVWKTLDLPLDGQRHSLCGTTHRFLLGRQAASWPATKSCSLRSCGRITSRWRLSCSC